MNRKLMFVSLAILLSGIGCSYKAHQAADNARTGAIDAISGSAMKQNEMYVVSPYRTRLGLSAGSEGSETSHRFIAVRHKLEILSNETSLPKAWQSVIDFCATIQCEVVTSSITARTGESTPSGSIVLRVAPQDFAKLFAETEKQGNIIQHTTESEDKTSEVVDIEAKIKNQSAYRDSLRAMLSKSSAKVSDLVDIQEKLTEIQSELDSEAAQRKILANETEKIAVEINFRVEPLSRTRSAFAPIADAFRTSGANLAESVATLISFVIAVIPWLVAMIFVVWLVKRLWRRRSSATRRNFA
jgi:hypothetical protein